MNQSLFKRMLLYPLMFLLSMTVFWGCEQNNSSSEKEDAKVQSQTLPESENSNSSLAQPKKEADFINEGVVFEKTHREGAQQQVEKQAQSNKRTITVLSKEKTKPFDVIKSLELKGLENSNSSTYHLGLTSPLNKAFFKRRNEKTSIPFSIVISGADLSTLSTLNLQYFSNDSLAYAKGQPVLQKEITLKQRDGELIYRHKDVVDLEPGRYYVQLKEKGHATPIVTRSILIRN